MTAVVDLEKGKSYCLTIEESLLRKKAIGEVKYNIEIELLTSIFIGKSLIEFEYKGGEV